MNVGLVGMEDSVETLIEIGVFASVEEAESLEPGYDYYLDMSLYTTPSGISPGWLYDSENDSFSAPPVSAEDVNIAAQAVADAMSNLFSIASGASLENKSLGLADATTYANGVLDTSLDDSWNALMETINPS